MPQNSTGREVYIGDRVRCRGEEYTIVRFIPGVGHYGTAGIEFDRPFHSEEMPDEIMIDLI